MIERAKVLLGTLVTIGVGGLDDADAHAALDRAFAVVADVHRLMSFHDAASDVSRLHRDAVRGAVRVDPRTLEVLRFALEMSAASDGAFDVSVAPRLVARGLLPRPEGASEPDERATWRDIEIVASDAVRFHRPLWIDLGGIAKGYAVDCAMAVLPADTPLQRRVNAGGDLRIAGPHAERVLLKVPGLTGESLPMIELVDGSIASSATADAASATHLDGRDGADVTAGQFVSVIAERCMVADALTKVVLAMGDAAEPILVRYGAGAHRRDAAGAWHALGAFSESPAP